MGTKSSRSSLCNQHPVSEAIVQGTQSTAAQQLRITADHAITLEAAANTQTRQSRNRSDSASVGVVLDQKGGVGVTVSGSLGRGKADGDDVSWVNTQLNAGQQATLQSGADTTLSGAVVTAPQVTVTTGGALTIESRQDSSRYRSEQKQVSGSATVGPAPSANLSLAQSQVDSTYTSVTDTSGIRAGDQGFAVAAAGATTLTGAAITSTQAAVEAKRNTFTTGGPLTTSDLENRAQYTAESVSVSLGTGFSPQGALTAAGTGVGFGNDRGEASSITKSGISGVAGDKAMRTGDQPTGIAKIFDAARVQKEVTAQTQITQTFSVLAPKQVAKYAGEQIKEIDQRLSTEADPERRASLLAERGRWEEGGSYRVMMHTAVGGLAGNVAGAAGAGAAAGAAPALNDLQSQLEGSLVKAGMNPTLAKGVAANVSGLAAAGIGGAVGGAAGAGAGLSVDANNRQLHPEETKWIKDHARHFAQQQGISEQEAERRLAQQAFRQVQLGASGAEDSQARSFLGQAKGMLAADPSCAGCGPGYLFYAPPHQKANTGMYANQVVSDPTSLEFYGKNGITQPSSKQVQTSANQDAETRRTIGLATMGAAGAAAGMT